MADTGGDGTRGDGDDAGGDAYRDRDAETEDDGRDWRFEVDELGPVVEPETLEPGRPNAENVFFVLLGAVVTVAVFVSLLL